MIALPDPALTAAITMLACLIAKASMPNATQTSPAARNPAETGDSGDE
jgi:hypothetical protein